MDLLQWLFEARIPVGSSSLLLREVIGNVFGLLSVLGGMRRRVWAWPVGIVGNVLLLTVFLGSAFGGAGTVDLLGQAGRQVMFIVVSVYGWRQWQARRQAAGSAVTPRWASSRARIGLVAGMILGTVALTPLFRALGSYEPVWADAWTFVGSLLATFGMAKGWVEFWLIWVAVDIVGVPLLFSAGYYASAVMYLIYGAFTIIGFAVWTRERRRAEARLVSAVDAPVKQIQ
ncbi:nicotinamide mononucleotide transporter [Arthrobacter sp. MSA 4-2]|uniref:nicotinamide riboside transporter PnuC n=1 Tax=Arthrobacter sp. MSA 4-2 TaxID=2794349 RepID=UPI0018E79A87|nr:nicotinamide riboside transporter PnuC [Arthrobacter sp. MSA 4-2]MBJ2121408.1 nicotinamide mononucleotide transporter [Arthrobacter sp. MSA 4-2]